MRAILRGIGQIYLQPSARSGLVFLTALALASWELALYGLAGSALGTATGVALRASRQDLDDGLYGFNAALVALAGGVFFPRHPSILVAVLISTLLFHLAVKRQWNVFTAPFVLTTLALFQLLTPAVTPLAPVRHVAEVLVRHFGQVVFLDGTWSGLLCVLGVFLGNRRSGLAALAASALVLTLGLLLPGDATALHGGLYGFNAVLTAIALHQQRPRWLPTLAGALLATVISALAMYVGMRPLTAPFIVVAWSGSRRRD